MENIGVGMPFSDLGQTRVYQSFSDLSAERYPVGFMDLLGVLQSNSRNYALIPTPPMQLPAISSASCEAVTGEEKKRDFKYEDDDKEEEEEERHKRKMRSVFVSFLP